VRLARMIAIVTLLVAVPSLMGHNVDDGAAKPSEISPATTIPNLVKNPGFENTKKTWQDTSCNYMALYAGSTKIPFWTVSSSTVNEIVWAMTPTCDGHTAAAGTFFIDLTGFGSDSPNGAVEQTLKNAIAGQTYNFSIDMITDNLPPLVTIDGTTITLTAGRTIKKGSDVWTVEKGTFVAQSTDPLLVIQNRGNEIGFIDAVSVRAQITPEK
jgi:hypothetical protein